MSALDRIESIIDVLLILARGTDAVGGGESVAEAEGVEPTKLNACLYDIIDPEALNALFRCGEDGSKSGGIVSFTFNGYEVDVHSDSSVEINPVER